MAGPKYTEGTPGSNYMEQARKGLSVHAMKEVLKRHGKTKNFAGMPCRHKLQGANKLGKNARKYHNFNSLLGEE